jgi:dCTP deaminase
MTESSSILTRNEIKNRLTETNKKKQLFITPLISDEQIGEVSIDLRLGNVFIIFKRTKFSGLDLLEQPKEVIQSRIQEFQERVYVPLGEKLFLHPQQLVLGSTLEYVRIPADLAAEVIGRSSWGRLGLILSAATLIHPGFAGVITLELANEGDVPIPLIPGLRITQLVVRKTNADSNGKMQKSKYLGTTEPVFSMLHQDSELEALRKMVEEKKKSDQK